MKEQIITLKKKNATAMIPETKPVKMTFSQLPYRKSVEIKGWL